MPRSTLTAAARTGLPASEVQSTIEAYRQLHDEDAEDGGLEARRAASGTMVNRYYDLVTDFYEYGWGQSFHFATRHRGEPFAASLLRHEHYLALRLGLRPGATVIDIGCGVGGPMRHISRFAGVDVVGVNNNAYQVERARQLNQRAGLTGRCQVVKADFMALPQEPESFDAAYQIEATCHAPDRVGVFSEVARVLRPGALFGGYEWCLTDRFDPADAEHRRLKQAIEEGDALPDLTPTRVVDDALRAAGFELLETADLTVRSDPETPWYLPLARGEWNLRGLARTPVGRVFTHGAVRALELARLAPRGATELSELLNRTADALVRSGELGIFTPMYFFVARRG